MFNPDPKPQPKPKKQNAGFRRTQLSNNMNDDRLRKTLIVRADRIFSKFIRSRHADPSGRVKCVTCPKVSNWREMDCGHFIKREHMATRFEPNNAHAQCWDCNRLKYGNMEAYEGEIVKRYGLTGLDKLRALQRTVVKFSVDELREIINKYK